MAKSRKPAADLFQAEREANLALARPLAARMRPRTLDEFVGQQHFLGPGKLLRRLLQADRLGSAVFHGPPGTGKTALAQVIANQTQGRFCPLNAVAAGTKEVRELLDEARAELEATGRRTILFVDELHRFNKAQQDVLLPDVEEGRVILIGATTQNPFFAVNAPLLSRSQIFTFEVLVREDIMTLLRRALADKERGLGNLEVHASDEALEFLAEACDGDARRALDALEVGVRLHRVSPRSISRWKPRRSRSSARCSFSIRPATAITMWPAPSSRACAAAIRTRPSTGSPACWNQVRIRAFIARRLVIFASEDVGNADPQALLIAAAAAQAVEFIGLPECQLNLAQAVTYLATAPKSNASTVAIGKAQEDVRSGRTLEVPKHLRDAHIARGSARTRARLSVQSRSLRCLGRSGLSAGGSALLRTGRTRLRSGNRPPAGGTARAAKEGNLNPKNKYLLLLERALLIS